MTAYTFKHIEAAKVSKKQILETAKTIRNSVPYKMTVQDSIDTAIDAWIERNQGA